MKLAQMTDREVTSTFDKRAGLTMATRFKLWNFILVATTLFSVSAWSQESEPLRFGLEGEFYLPVPIQNATLDADRLRIQSLEITSLADFSEWVPNLSGKLTIGGEDTSGDLTLSVREGFVNATDILAKGFDVRVGKFFLPIGVLNQTRRSAWPFLSAPRPLTVFLAPGGVVDQGVDVGYVSGAFSIRAGVTNGFRFDSGIQASGVRPLTPTHFLRPEISLPIDTHIFALAGNYLARVDSNGDTLRLAGVDFQLIPKDCAQSACDQAWSAMGEFYHRFTNPSSQGLPITEQIGGYAFLKRQFTALYAMGLRGDFYQIPTLTNQSGTNRKNSLYALAPVLTYEIRNHFRIDAGYTALMEAREGDTTRYEQTFEFRLVTEWGEIPKFRSPTRDRSWLSWLSSGHHS